MEGDPRFSINVFLDYSSKLTPLGSGETVRDLSFREKEDAPLGWNAVNVYALRLVPFLKNFISSGLAHPIELRTRVGRRLGGERG